MFLSFQKNLQKNIKYYLIISHNYAERHKNGPFLAKLNSSNEKVSTQFTCSVVNHVHIMNSGSSFNHTPDQKNSVIKLATNLNSSPKDRSHVIDNIVDSQHQVGSQPRVRTRTRLKCFEELTSCCGKFFFSLFILLFFLVSSNFVDKVEVDVHISGNSTDFSIKSCFFEKVNVDIHGLVNYTDYGRTKQSRLISITRFSLIDVYHCMFLWHGCFVHRKVSANRFTLLSPPQPKVRLEVSRLFFQTGLDPSGTFATSFVANGFCCITGAVVVESQWFGEYSTSFVILSSGYACGCGRLLYSAQ